MSATQTAGIVSRLTRCEKHGIEYAQIFFSSLPEGFWVGQCEKCKDEERFEQEVRRIAAGRKDAVDREVFARMLAHGEDEILKEAEDRLEKYLAQCRADWLPAFVSEVRSQVTDAERAEAEEEEVDKIKQELRKEKK